MNAEFAIQLASFRQWVTCQRALIELPGKPLPILMPNSRSNKLGWSPAVFVQSPWSRLRCRRHGIVDPVIFATMALRAPFLIPYSHQVLQPASSFDDEHNPKNS